MKCTHLDLLKTDAHQIRISMTTPDGGVIRYNLSVPQGFLCYKVGL